MRRWLGSSAQRLGCVVLAAFLASGCSSPPEPLRIGMDTWPPYGLFHLAQQKGFFAAEGVEVKLFDFMSLSDTRRAFENGKLDGVAITLVEVLMARDASPRDLRAVRVMDVSAGADVILAPTTVRSMRDLRGRRIGVEPASLNTYVLARALEKEGMKLADIIAVPGDPHSMCDDLLAGKLDAVVTYPPESARVLAEARFHAVFSSRDIPGEIVDVLAFEADVLERRPDEVAAVQRALDRALAYLDENPEESFAIMADRVGITPEQFAGLLESGITLAGPGPQAELFGPDGKLQVVTRSIAATLRGAGLLSGRPGVEDGIFVRP